MTQDRNPDLTAESKALDFAAQYAERSGVTVEWLHEHGRDPYRCLCGEDGCEGWAMMSPDIATWEIERERAEDVCGWLDGLPTMDA